MINTLIESARSSPSKAERSGSEEKLEKLTLEHEKWRKEGRIEIDFGLYTASALVECFSLSK